MFPVRTEIDDLRRRIAALPPAERFLLAEDILADVRKAHFTDHDAQRREVAGLVAHETTRRVVSLRL